jgi:hypothetical protein
MTIETKYNIGDDVWFMNNNIPCQDKIYGISCIKTKSSQSQSYCLEQYKRLKNCEMRPFLIESQLFKTKKELIASL